MYGCATFQDVLGVAYRSLPCPGVHKQPRCILKNNCSIQVV